MLALSVEPYLSSHSSTAPPRSRPSTSRSTYLPANTSRNRVLSCSTSSATTPTKRISKSPAVSPSTRSLLSATKQIPHTHGIAVDPQALEFQTLPHLAGYPSLLAGGVMQVGAPVPRHRYSCSASSRSATEVSASSTTDQQRATLKPGEEPQAPFLAIQIPSGGYDEDRQANVITNCPADPKSPSFSDPGPSRDRGALSGSDGRC